LAVYSFSGPGASCRLTSLTLLITNADTQTTQCSHPANFFILSFILDIHIMIFSTTFIPVMLALLITPVLSAPVHVRKSEIHTEYIHSPNPSLDKRSPLFWGHHHPQGPAPSSQNAIESHQSEHGELNSRSIVEVTDQPLTKREESHHVRLVRRKGKAKPAAKAAPPVRDLLIQVRCVAQADWI